MRALSVLAALVLAAPSQAQVFEPGFVVRDGVREAGYVALGTEAENAVRVRFKPSLNGAEVELGPDHAEAYGTDRGLSYRAGRYRVQAPGAEDPTTPAVRAGFARVVREGATTLLAFETRDRAPVFFATSGQGDPVGLYLVTTVGGPGRTSDERPLYRQALLVALGRCAGGPAAYEELAYTEAALAARVDVANACEDPSYVPPDAVSVRRRAIVLRAEVGAAWASGRFERLRGEPATTTDPATTAPVVAAALVVQGAPVEWLQLVTEVDFSPGTVDIAVFTGTGYRIRRVSTAHLGLGVRAVADVAGLDVGVGAGLLAGTAFSRVVLENATVDDDGDRAVWNVRGDDFTSSGGQYVEAAFGARRWPAVAVTVRGQRTLYSDGRVHMPGIQGYLHKDESVAVGVRMRIGR